MNLNIYRESLSSVIASTSAFEVNRTLMEVRKITCSMKSVVPIEWAPYNGGTYDFVMYNDEKYILYAKPTSEDRNEVSKLTYKLIFSGQEILLQNAPFLDVVTGTGSSIDEYRYTNGSIVNFFGDIRQFVLRLNANITYFNNHGGDLAGWTVELDLSPEYDYREFNVSSANSSLLDALSIINSAYSLKYYFNTTGTNKKVIITDKVRNTIDYVFEQGEDKGLYNISATVSADKDVVTRLRPLGGSRNIPTDYKNDAKPIDNTRYCPNLMLPNDANGNIVYTIDSASGIQKYGVREKSVTQEFEGIYPSIRNVSLQDVYGTSSLPATGNDGVKLTGLTASQRVDQLIGASKVLNEQQSYFYVYLTDIGFYLDKTNEDGIYVYATTNEAVISMRTGLYTGVEFTIVKGKTKQLTGAVQENPDMDIAQTADDVAMYNAGARYRVKLIRTEDNGAKFPSVNTSVPALSAGSEFVILNIFMPPVYVTMAENKLKQAAIEFLSIYDHSLYTIGLNIATGFTIEHPEIFLNQFLEGAKLKVKSNKIGVLNDSGGPVEINIQSVTISYSENTLFPTYNCTLAEIKKQTIFEQLSSEIRNVSASQTSLQSAGLSASAVSDILQRLQIIDNMFEWDKERTAIKAKYNFYGIGEITAYGYGTEIPWTTSLGNLTNVVNNADDVAGVDYILYKPKGASTWALKDASDIGGQGKIYYAGSGISLTDSNGDTANTINVRFGQGAGLVMEGSDSRVLTAINDIANIKKTTFWGQTMINNKVEGALVNTGNITPSATNVSTVGTMDLVYKVMYATSFVGALLGNATSSSMWDSAITLIAGGDASGSTEIRGDANATLTLSVNKLHTARSLWGQSFNGTANVSGAISSTGHITPSSTGVSDIGSTTFKYRNIYGNLVGNVSGNVSGTLTGNVTGNVSGSAGSLATTRTIWGQNFNGTQNVLGEMSGVSIINKVLFFNGTNVGINHATPNVALHVSGTIKSTGEVVAYATSDYDPSQDIPKASKTSYGWVKIGDNINVVDGVISAAKQGMDEVALAAYLSSNGYINSTNYTNYTVTKTGGGASGTWAIGISGNAATASSAAKLTTARNIALSGAVTGSANFDGSTNITIATSFAQNFDSKYVLKAGDTMSGNLILNDSAATGSRMLKFTGYTDYAHIKFSAASSDNSFLEIATGDNGNTPIYIRQYNTSGSVTHETVLMDGNGDTIFGHHVISNIAPFSRRMRSDSSNAEWGFQFISKVSVSQLAWIGYHNTAQNLWLSPQPAESEWWLASKKGLRIGTTSMGFNGNTVWHAGNDGAGSGLDADLLDGKQSNKFYIDYRADIANGQIDTFVLRDSGSYSYNYTGASQQLTVFAGKGGSCSAVEILSHYNNIHKIRTIIDNNRYSGWLDLITSSNYGNYVYSKTDADSRFVNVTGDTMTGILNFNMSDVDPVIWVKQNGTNKGAFGWLNSQGIYMFNPSGNHYLGILDNGTPHFNNYALYCEANAGSFYSWSRATRNSYKVWDLSNTTTYNVNTYYPVTIVLSTAEMTRHEIQVSLDSGTKPSWSTHAQGYSVRLVWEENGAGWGTIPIIRKIISATYSFAGQSPIGGITQLTNSSTCVLWLRGGGKYFYYSNGQRTKGGPYTTQQTISNQTFTTRTLDEGAQGWHDITTGWLSNEYFKTGPMDVAGEIKIRGDHNGAGAIYYYWNGRNKDTLNWTSRISESASGRLAIPGKLVVGTTYINDSYALSATSFYSSGNLTVSGRSTFSGTVNTNTINCTTIYSSDWLRTTGAKGWYNETYGGGIYMTDTSYVRVYNNKSFVSHRCVNSPSGFNVAQNGGTGVGISLYGYETTSVSNPTYGLMFAHTSDFGRYGTVTGDWATYFTMSADSNRGWIFRMSNGTYAASISCYGDIYAKRNIVAYGEMTAYSTSDIRLKKNIINITTNEAINILSKIRPVTYEWNDKAFELNSHQRYKGRETGLIAQEVISILPCAIKTVFDEYMSIDYTRFIPPIIAVVNEHELEIQRLKAEIKRLKERLVA